MVQFYEDKNWPLGGKSTTLRPFHPGRARDSSSWGQILILRMDLLCLPEEPHVNTTIQGLLEYLIHMQGIPF